MHNFLIEHWAIFSIFAFVVGSATTWAVMTIMGFKKPENTPPAQ